MKELRWVLRKKGDLKIIKTFKYKWMAKLSAAFRIGKHSIALQKTHKHD